MKQKDQYFSHWMIMEMIEYGNGDNQSQIHGEPLTTMKMIGIHF